MSTSPNLNLSYLYPAQSQKHVTINDALSTLDALTQLSVISLTQSTPPVTPENGDRYIPAASATGDWVNQQNNILVWRENAWLAFTPRPGWRVWVEDLALDYLWNGSDWTPVPVSTSEIQNLEFLGVNAAADLNNRVVVSGKSVLLDNEGDDIRLALNKETSTDTASLLYQTAHSGRAELGLTGANDFTIKVSADGTVWNDAMTINHTSGECTLNKPLALPQYTTAALPSPTQSGRIIFVTDASGGPTTAYSDGADWRRTNDASIIN